MRTPLFKLSDTTFMSGLCYNMGDCQSLCREAGTNPMQPGEVRVLTNDKSRVTCQECLELIHS